MAESLVEPTASGGPKRASVLARIFIGGTVAKDQAEPLQAMRHSLAHHMASALQQRWHQAKFGVGSVTSNGFYYDVDIQRLIDPEDLAKIEREMEKIIKADLPFERIELTIHEAITKFKKSRQDFK